MVGVCLVNRICYDVATWRHRIQAQLVTVSVSKIDVVGIQQVLNAFDVGVLEAKVLLAYVRRHLTLSLFGNSLRLISADVF